jgi:hypothetical protein
MPAEDESSFFVLRAASFDLPRLEWFAIGALTQLKLQLLDRRCKRLFRSYDPVLVLLMLLGLIFGLSFFSSVGSFVWPSPGSISISGCGRTGECVVGASQRPAIIVPLVIPHWLNNPRNVESVEGSSELIFGGELVVDRVSRLLKVPLIVLFLDLLVIE